MSPASSRPYAGFFGPVPNVPERRSVVADHAHTKSQKKKTSFMDAFTKRFGEERTKSASKDAPRKPKKG